MINNPSPDTLATLIINQRTKGHRPALLAKIEQIYGKSKMEEVRELVIERFPERGFKDYGHAEGLFSVGEISEEKD